MSPCARYFDMLVRTRYMCMRDVRVAFVWAVCVSLFLFYTAFHTAAATAAAADMTNMERGCFLRCWLPMGGCR